ncbi:YfiR family protein [Candidatus Albibeggiatoa sp. nov. NOAA]|uniref:YfiR family protein n=1 Tax=Candidatus Albibeggiatoa sp. nov. NOAA TaxID=3162724 RepID=UPI0032F923F1|nr:YfiR family protein [Thiotrichaceae bacterium]
MQYTRFVIKSLIAFIVINVLFVSRLYADDAYNEYHIKAAFLYNLTLMVKWPDERSEIRVSEPLVICTLGQDPFGKLLDTIKENKVRKRSLILKRNIELSQSRDCHVLFIVRSEKDNVSRILSYVKGLPILTISEIPKFANAGGMVNMVKRRNRVKLEINLNALKRERLYANARLLVLAKIID